jgi:SAM-dependent methyltransferase
VINTRFRITAIAACGLIIIIGFIYQSGQHKPDVGWAPTPVGIAAQGLTWASIGPHDLVYELGCGDGRVAIVAAQLGARVVCIEIDPVLAAAAAAAVKAAGLEDRIDVLQEDIFNIDLSPATMVFMFLLPSVNERLRPVFEASLRPGTRIISREFEIQGWPPGERLELPGFLFLGWTMGEHAGQPSMLNAGTQSDGDDET